MTVEAAKTDRRLGGSFPRRVAGSGVLRFILRKPLGALGAFMLASVILAALFAPLAARYDTNAQDYQRRLEGPSLSHFMGTDEFGRDLWARVVHGSRISLLVGFASVLVGATIGLALGVFSGYAGGIVDDVMQRVVEVMLSLPGIFLALALVATLGSGLDKLIIALIFIYIPRTLRVIRGAVLSVKQNSYIDAAKAVGARPMRIMSRHILPNVMAPYLILASGLLANAILIEATLSYLGLGVPPPHPSWGRMLANSVAQYAAAAPWMVIFPGLAITWLVLGFNLLGDTIRDAWDPRLRGL